MSSMLLPNIIRFAQDLTKTAVEKYSVAVNWIASVALSRQFPLVIAFAITAVIRAGTTPTVD